MNLNVNYMGLNLTSPVIVSSSKFTSTPEGVHACAKAGAGAVVLKSMFEEQILSEINVKLQDNAMYFYYPEAMNHVQNISKDHGVNEYLKLIENSKNAGIPIIASINCVSAGEWTKFAEAIEKAGAAAIELNIAIFPYNSLKTSEDIEKTYIEILTEVKKNVSIPVSVKLGNSFTSLNNMTRQLCEAGANALVLFNRFYAPDIDIEKLEVVNQNIISAPEEISESLRWIGILSNQLSCDFSATTGIHDARGVLKQLLAGATTTQLCSTLYKHGVDYIKIVNADLMDWMTRHRFNNIEEFKGKMNRSKQNIASFERIQYIKKTTGAY